MAHHTFFFLLWRHGQDTIIILIVWTDLGFNARKVWDTKLSCGLLIVPPSVEDASIRIVYWCSVLVKGDPPMSSLGEPIRLPKNAKEFHHHHEVSQKVRLTLQAHPLPRRKWIYIFHFFYYNILPRQATYTCHKCFLQAWVLETAGLRQFRATSHIRAKSRDHGIVRAQKEVTKCRPNTPPTSCSVVTDPQV